MGAIYVLTHVPSPGAYYGATLDVLVLVMRVAWFTLPLLPVSGDVVDGAHCTAPHYRSTAASSGSRSSCEAREPDSRHRKYLVDRYV